MRFFPAAVASIALLARSVASLPAGHAQPRDVAAALASDPPFQITNLTIAYNETGNTTLNFTVLDPETLAKGASANCSGTWDTQAKGWPVSASRLACNSTPVTFYWYMESFNSAKDFVVNIQDTYTDEAVGQAPYDRVTIFARGIVNETYVTYNVSDTGVITGNQTQAANATIFAPVYAIMA